MSVPIYGHNNIHKTHFKATKIIRLKPSLISPLPTSSSSKWDGGWLRVCVQNPLSDSKKKTSLILLGPSSNSLILSLTTAQTKKVNKTHIHPLNPY
jgi:hypothetical protein